MGASRASASPTTAEPLEREEQARALEAALRRADLTDLRFDRLSRILYSSDASNYQIEPLGVACPRDADEVAAAVSVCAALGLPITARAGGTSLAGQAIGAGLVLDTARHLRRMAISPDRQLAIVEPGVVLEDLNREAARHGLAFGPDPASANRACMGGIVANNATGARSVAYGMAAEHLRAAEVVLSDGARAAFHERHPFDLMRGIAGGAREQAIYLALNRIVNEGVGDIARDFPRYWRRSGGYNLDRLVERALGSGALPDRPLRPSDPTVYRFVAAFSTESSFDSAHPERKRVETKPIELTFRGQLDPSVLLAGSEGTLAIATSLELGLVRLPPRRGLLVAQFDRLQEAFEAVPPILEHSPTAIELVDRQLLHLARQAPGYADDLAFVQGDPAAILIIEKHSLGSSERDLTQGLDAVRLRLEREGFHGPFHQATRPVDQARVWRLRRAGLGLLASRRGDMKPVAGIEDTAVPPERLARYMAEVRALLDETGVEAAFYAHASAGCIHVRPILDLKTARGLATLDHLSEAIFTLVLKHGGVLSSEHGDGLARSGFNQRLFGPAVYGMFKDLKQAFDPQNILNPGKVVGPLPSPSQLRYGPGYSPSLPAARFAYPLDGDIQRAIEQCNGVGVCRTLGSGSMCPSYRVTLEERDSTRGRANALRAALDGRLPLADLASDAVHEAMDLCIGCKACKVECPAGVDMARLKIETSAARGAARGFAPRAQLFARLNALDRVASRAPRLANAVLAGPLAARLGPRLGLHPERRFPALADESLDRWWRRQRGGPSSAASPEAPGLATRPTLVLFADTITTYPEPGIGRAVLALAEAAGYQASLPRRRCCGRPALSQGMVDLARRDMRANLAILAPHARAGRPILVPEPSCASVFRDELPDLLTGPDEVDAARLLADAVLTVEEWLARLPADALEFQAGPAEALLHLHCHQRALVGPAPTLAALSRIPGLKVHEPDAGCCGMAGAFGYELEHHATSLAMARRKLIPAIAALAPDAPILAPGASCRQQIADLGGRRALHPVELLAAQLMAP